MTKKFKPIYTEEGLSQLAGRRKASEAMESFQIISVQLLNANPHQPRIQISEEEIDELVQSIRDKGFLQPLLARLEETGSYTLIAGHRRLQAALRAGITHVPIIEKKVSDDDLLSYALAENIQRVKLHPVDQAKAFGKILEKNQGNETHAAKELNISRTSFIRYTEPLKLSEEILAIAGSIPDISWSQLLGLVKIPESRRLSAAKMMAGEGFPKSPVPSPARTTKKGITYKITTPSNTSFKIELRTRKKDPQLSEVIEAVRALLLELENQKESEAE
ncbi:MAG: ParB/RepB/Spo0J family partition protein [Blastocatellia bacterium]|nr:ParB/RepB/Spo0J family partition protein [Blastocatellia bacterium]